MQIQVLILVVILVVILVKILLVRILTLTLIIATSLYLKEDLNIKVDRMIIQEAVANRKKSDKGIKIARPRVFIPVFPGTNCEYDTKKAFEKAGAIVDIFVLRNLSSKI